METSGKRMKTETSQSFSLISFGSAKRKLNKVMRFQMKRAIVDKLNGKKTKSRSNM